MRFDVITLFPEWVASVTENGVLRRASEKGLVSVKCTNPRDYSTDVHRTVDDRPYGGGPGMVMKADCLLDAIRDVRSANKGKLIYLSPQGQRLSQTEVIALAAEKDLILLCGRYEGIDERVIELEVDAEYSIGDYVLSGGELGAMVLIDSVSRLLPGVLGHDCSAEQDSFSDGLLDCSHYTRPEVVEGEVVPDVLKSGNHAAIAKWRRKQSLGITWVKRPDLLEQRILQPADQKLLDEYIQEYKVSSEVNHE
uniref:tRNA (guanine-N(1)-)-methyltransferase n=1 Tax=uncultured Thiotrichaceae bacterium TaxID=298394 RepID=A0A6S6TZV0_9GAMM|nr:MAG: tRNA (Guanine37-N1) -methyltransferase (EC [uncultured Thiotrichaceae bacterium]